MKRFILFSLFMIPAAALAQQQQFGWLIGKWKLKDSPVYEVWASGGDSVLYGKAYRVSGKDTIRMESITIQYANGVYQYVPTVPENKKPVSFTMSSYDDRSFVAENAHHDFPKIIRYMIVRKGDDEFIEASIEGNGKVISYTFQKAK